MITIFLVWLFETTWQIKNTKQAFKLILFRDMIKLVDKKREN